MGKENQFFQITDNELKTVIDALENYKSKDVTSELMVGLLEHMMEPDVKKMNPFEREEYEMKKAKREKEKEAEEKKKKIEMEKFKNSIDILKAKIILLKEAENQSKAQLLTK
jgi:hypothetical protein